MCPKSYVEQSFLADAEQYSGSFICLIVSSRL